VVCASTPNENASAVRPQTSQALGQFAAHADHEPLTRGMRAAIPHTDRLLPGNSLASLEELAVILEEV